MISNIIKLGKNVDITPFSESIPEDQEIIETRLTFSEDGSLVLEDSEVKKKGNKRLYHISPTKAINRGKNQHFYLHDFTLSKSFLKDDNGAESRSIDRGKVNRNYRNTEDVYEGLDVKKNFEDFIEVFYEFVLNEDSEFIEDVFEQNESFFRNLSKRDFENLVFSYSLSKKLIDYYDLKVTVDINKSHYYLGEIEEFEDLIKNLIVSETLDEADENSKCSFCSSEKDVYAPSNATIYFSFAKNPENVFYNLDSENADKHLLICRECYDNYIKGKKFIEDNLRSNLLGSKYFTVFEVEGESERIGEALNYVIANKPENIYSQDSLKSLRHSLADNDRIFLDLGVIGRENNMGVSLFFYEYDNGYRVLKTIHDIYPNRILDLLRENSHLKDFSFNAFLNSFFRDKNDKTYGLLVKQKLDLLEKILLDAPINYDSLLNRFLEKTSYKLRNEENSKRFTKRFLRFLELLDRLDLDLYSNNKFEKPFRLENNSLSVDSMTKSMSKTGLEKMEAFLEENPFLASSPEIKAGLPLGVIIARLSSEISNYDKRMLGYARKRINDLESLKKYVNEIEEKVVMHDMKNQEIVSEFFEQLPKVFSNDEFSKDDFILGLFTGHSLAFRFTNE